MSVATAVRERITGIFVDSVYDNPVMSKELRTRMRGKKAFITMGAYALLLSGVLFITYLIVWSMRSSSGYGYSIVNSKVGLHLFASLTWTQAILLMLMAPSLTSGMLTHEISKRTMEMLALTRLTAGNIVLGKMLSGFFYILMLLVSSVPLAGICFMFGAISPAEVALTYLLLVSYAFLFSAIGVFWSSLFDRTPVALIFGQVTCLAYMIGTLVLGGYGIETVLLGRSTNPHALSLLNPGWAPYGAMMSSKVCGISVSMALAAFLVQAAIGCLLLLVASTHVRYHRVERALPIRVLLLLTMIGITWLSIGCLNLLTPAGPPKAATMLFTPTPDAIFIISFIILAATCLLAALFATGEVRNNGKSILRYALSPRRMFKSDIGGSILFMVLLTAALCGTFGIICLWPAKAASFRIAGVFWASYLKIGVTMLATVAMTAAVGILASSIVKTRNNAAALVVAFFLLLLACYAIILECYQDGISNPHSPIWQLAALWPLTPILAATKNWEQGAPKLWWTLGDSWIVTSCIYIVMAMLALCFASKAVKKYGGVKED